MSTTPSPATLPIKTHHCRFCANLLIASTRDFESLPRRGNRTDAARILPLRNNSYPPTSDKSVYPGKLDESGNGNGDEMAPDSGEGNGEDGNGGKGQGQKHYTILLSTSFRNSKATMIRRNDGFEKRFFFRCGRCRVTIGYFLDEVHFPVEGGLKARGVQSGEGEEGEDRAVYLLPGALMETEIMSDEEKMRAVDREWGDWFK